MITYKKLGFME